MKTWLLITGNCLLLLFTGAAQAQSQSAWRIFPIENFNIYYQPEDSLNALHIARILLAEYPPISRELEVTVASPIGLFIAPSLGSFNKLTGGAIPHWGGAVADPNKQLIILKSPRWSQQNRSLRQIIIHEVVHILVGRLAGNAHVPRWLNEGIATYFAGETGYAEGKELSRAQLTKQLIPLDNIDAVLSFKTLKAHLAYQQAYLAVVYIAERYGESALPELLRALREKGEIHAAFRATFGLSLEQFETEWRAYLKQKYRWSFLREFDTFLWVFIVLLFLIVVAVIIRRNRKTVSRWEREDEWEWE